MKLYNTLTRNADEMGKPMDKKVKIYNCGLTVYSQPHIGNWVGYIYWDVLARVLKMNGYSIERTQNYTDVGHLVSDDDSGEDKMEKGARREGLTAWDVAEKYIKVAEHEGYGLLGLQKPDHLARATDYIPQQIEFVKRLEEQGYTYEIPGDGIYFDTSRLDDYGKLARLNIEGLEAGKRVSVEGKKSITDFAVWKFSPNGQQRDMEWDSPWGKGFPGWHLECSVIARETLGDQIDIHTGGVDHIPVHHTNEIAQTEAVTGKPFSRFWLHNNHLKVEGGKMAKSLGNVYTLADITERGFDLTAFKLFVLSKHYRTEGNFTWEHLEAAQNRLRSFQAFADLLFQTADADESLQSHELDEAWQGIIQALSEDLNTPQALARLNQLVDLANAQNVSTNARQRFEQFLYDLDGVLGLGLSGRHDITDEQKSVIAGREAARHAKDWHKSDELRDSLAEQGVGLRDTPHGAIWYRL